MSISERYKAFIAKNIEASQLKDCEAELLVDNKFLKVIVKNRIVTMYIAEVNPFKGQYLPLKESDISVIGNNQGLILKEVRRVLAEKLR